MASDISLASSIIGFISFAVSVSTLVRVLWGELATLFDAPAQVHFSLSNLKEALYEERNAVKVVARIQRRRSSSHRRRSSGRHSPAGHAYMEPMGPMAVSGMDVRIMKSSIRALCQRFATLEEPFLLQGQVPGRTGKSENWDDEETATRYTEDGFENDYCGMTLALRLRWLVAKGQVDSLWVQLNRFQLRRIAREVTINLYETHALDQNLKDLKLVNNDPAAGSDSDTEGQARIHVRRKRRQSGEGSRRSWTGH